MIATAEDARLAFAYARRHGVVLDHQPDGAVLYCRASTPLSVVAEVRRFNGALLRSEVLVDEAEWAEIMRNA